MDVRDATPEDVEPIAGIYHYYVRTNICTLETSQPSTEAIRNDFFKGFASHSPFIVAAESTTGKICGYAYTGPFNERSGYKYTCEDSIYIHPGYRGKGLGKQLLKTLLEKLRATSDTAQVIAKMSILPDQTVEQLPSGRLHISLGFEVVGRLRKVGYKFDKWIDVIILQLDLSKVQL